MIDTLQFAFRTVFRTGVAARNDFANVLPLPLFATPTRIYCIPLCIEMESVSKGFVKRPFAKPVFLQARGVNEKHKLPPHVGCLEPASKNPLLKSPVCELPMLQGGATPSVPTDEHMFLARLFSTTTGEYRRYEQRTYFDLVLVRTNWREVYGKCSLKVF